MEWLGWGCALVVGGLAAWLWRQLAGERAHTSDLLCARLEAENRLDVLQVERDAQAAMVDADAVYAAVAERLDAPLEAARAHLESADAAFADYRERVKKFDAAVQYCLQPVELIFGADKASLDQLVHHVESARRKLFDARTELTRHPLHSGAAALGGGLDDISQLTDYAQALRSGGEAAMAAADPVGAPMS